MNIKTLASAATLLCTLAPLTLASAQTSYPTYVFETVDSIDADYRNTLKITGILQGEATPSTIVFTVPSTTSPATFADITRTCEHFALIAMNKPGQYYLDARGTNGYGLMSCKLTRR